MSLTRWMPLRSHTLARREPFLALHGEMNRLFDDVLRGFAGEPLANGENSAPLVPRLDVAETPEALRVEAELPGVSLEDINVTLEDGVLTITGEHKASEERKSENYVHVERRFGSFARRIPVNVAIDEDAIEATFDKGVLTVRLPKAAEVADKARRIQVKSA